MNMLTPFERRNYDLWGTFRDIEDSFFGGRAASFKTDIRDEGDKYVLESELPGFEKEDIGVELCGDYLTVTAQKSGSKEEKDSGNYLRRERSSCSYQRSFNISSCNGEGIEAEYKNGILTVVLPKQEEKQPQTKRLEIK